MLRPFIYVNELCNGYSYYSCCYYRYCYYYCYYCYYYCYYYYYCYCYY